MPRFSIVMPCFNAAATLNYSIAAIQAQSCQDWELICIDDGSEDETASFLSEWQHLDHRIRWCPNTGNGPSVARNLGAALAQGEIIAFCDADDIWAETKLAELEQAFEDQALDGAFGQIAFFQSARPFHAETVSTVPETPLSIPQLLGENPVCTMSNIAIRRVAFQQVGGFNVNLVHNEDLEWLVRCVGHGLRIAGIDQLQVWYRTSTGGLSANLPAMMRSRRAVLDAARRFGFAPSARNEAIYLRYLTRRALRVGTEGRLARELCLKGLRQSPRGYLFPLRRGLATAVAAFALPLLPQPLRQSVLARPQDRSL